VNFLSVQKFFLQLVNQFVCKSNYCLPPAASCIDTPNLQMKKDASLCHKKYETHAFVYTYECMYPIKIDPGPIHYPTYDGLILYKRSKNVTTRSDVCIVNYRNNKTPFSHTNIMSYLDIRILGLTFCL
jgi:hypothetical protein